MTHTRRAVAVVFVAALAGAATLGTAAHANPGTPAPLTYQQIAALPPAQQADLLNPLRITAGAVDSVGRSSGADIYSGVEIDASAHVVNLYLTKPGRAASFLRSARAGTPAAELALVRVKSGTYTKQQLDAARDRIAANLATLPVSVVEATVPADGSALQIGVAAQPLLSPNSASAQALAGTAGVAVQVVAGHTLTGGDRYGDTPPFWAGAYIIDSGWSCTTGVPVKNGSGHQYILTASHCGHTGTHWRTGRGLDVGNVVNYSEHWDAALIDASSGAYEWDGPPGPTANFIRLSGTAYSYNGDLVCQDGYTTGVACGIRVDNEDVTDFRVRGDRYGNTFSARGVRGHQVNGGVAFQHGDSGGLVFAINSSTTRQVRGLGSALVDGMGVNGIFWTEALDIYNQFGVHLTDN
jgi:hypothetical protein